MSNLLIFFVFPLATIIISVVLERVWNSYILVTALTFAIYLIVSFALGDNSLLVLVIIYTLLSFISAFLSMALRNLIERLNDIDKRKIENESIEENNEENDMNIEDRCENIQNLSINANVVPNSSNNGRTGIFRGRYRRRF